MLQNCYLKISQNISYESRTLLSCICLFLLQQTEERIQRSSEKLLFVDKTSNAATSEMILVLISSFDEIGKQVFKGLILFVEVSSMASETVMAALAKILKYQDMDIKQISLLLFMVPNSTSGKTKVVQQRIKSY